MELIVTGELVHWRGPAPYHFVPLAEAAAADVRRIAAAVTYGWGVIPVRGRVGDTSFRTSLFPKDGTYLIPLKDAVRRSEGIELGDMVTVTLSLAG